MGESPVGLRCPGDLIDLQCATSGEEGGCIRSSGGGQTSREEGRKCGEMSNSSSETLAGHQARGSQNSSGSRQRTGGAFTSRTNEGPNQTGAGNWGKKPTRKFWGITRQLYSKPWEENGAEPPSLYFQEYEGQNTFANGKENFPKAKCIKSTQLLMMKTLALWIRAAQQTQFPWQVFWHSPALALSSEKGMDKTHKKVAGLTLSRQL